MKHASGGDWMPHNNRFQALERKKIDFYVQIHTLYHVYHPNTRKNTPSTTTIRSAMKNLETNYGVKIVISSRIEFTKCSFCDFAKRFKEKVTGDVHDQLVKAHAMHLRQIKEERKYLTELVTQSTRDPCSYHFLQVDGMDQMKTYLPQPPSNTKSNEHLYSLPTHVVGVYMAPNMPYNGMAYITTKAVLADSQLTCAIIHRTIVRLATAIAGNVNGQRRWAKKLSLSLDNSGRDNKNFNLFHYLGLLVALNVYEEVEVFFLRPGHTHERVDQMFSRISTQLNTSTDGVMTMSELKTLIYGSYKSTSGGVEVEELSKVAAMDEFFLSHESAFPGFSTTYTYIIRVHHIV